MLLINDYGYYKLHATVLKGYRVSLFCQRPVCAQQLFQYTVERLVVK